MLLGLSAYNSSDSDDEQEKSLKQRKKISIPKVDYHSSDEDEGPSAKKPNLGYEQKKTSGLFSKLPPPRNTIGNGKQTNRPLIPHIFTKKPATTSISKTNTDQSITNNDVDSDNDESVDFFSFVDKQSNENSSSLPNIDVPATNITLRTPDIDVSLPQSPTPDSVAAQNSSPEHNTNAGSISSIKLPASKEHIQQSAEASYPDITSWEHDDRFKRIRGKANRKEKIEFIDVNADSALEGNKQLLLQQISEEKNLNRMSHSKKNKDAPSATSKRKHQMSYLIHQAKEREIELKNAWASGHAARQAARNRYGF